MSPSYLPSSIKIAIYTLKNWKKINFVNLLLEHLYMELQSVKFMVI